MTKIILGEVCRRFHIPLLKWPGGDLGLKNCLQATTTFKGTSFPLLYLSKEDGKDEEMTNTE